MKNKFRKKDIVHFIITNHYSGVPHNIPMSIIQIFDDNSITLSILTDFKGYFPYEKGNTVCGELKNIRKIGKKPKYLN